MKKFIITLLFLIYILSCIYSDNPEKILMDSLKNSITEGSFANFDQDLVFIEWTTLIDEKKASNDTDYVGQSATINYLRTNDYSYKKLVYTIFSMTSEVTKQRIMLYDRSSLFVNDRLSRDVIKTTAKASIAEIVDEDLKLKEKYKIIASDSDNLRNRDTWKITIQNTETGSTTIFWIDKEYKVRLQEDYFDRYPILY